MTWNWQQPDWPNFIYDTKALEPLEQQFLGQAGEFVGAYRHVGAEDQDTLKIDLISEEAVKTSEIEGEILNRDSVQSSLRAQLGLGAEAPDVKQAERGISKMMLDLYRNYADPLSDQTMFEWHKMLLAGDKDIKVIGGYRTHADAMEVVSGPIHKRTVHFEAPPSARAPAEMKRFVAWFNDSAPGGKKALPALTRAALAHLYFICIHPFEDGNGRIGRALAEKALAQNLGQPTLIALAYTIERKRKTTRSSGSISILPRPNSTRNSASSSTSVRPKWLPACSAKASTGSRAASPPTTTSASARHHARPRPATCKTWSRRARSPKRASCG